MTEHDRISVLEHQLAQLRARVCHDDESRQQLLSATDSLLPALRQRQAQWEHLFTATLENMKRSPQIGEARGDGLLTQYALLATRLRSVEENYAELAKLAVENYSLTKDILDWLQKQG